MILFRKVEFMQAEPRNICYLNAKKNTIEHVEVRNAPRFEN
jgi:hypothetical protein